MAALQGAHQRDDRHQKRQVGVTRASRPPAAFAPGPRTSPAGAGGPGVPAAAVAPLSPGGPGAAPRRASRLRVAPQEDVPGAEGERVGAGPQRHVLLPAGLRSGRRAPLEVRERGVGAGREAGAAGAQLRLHPPRLAQLRRALDEGARLLQQSQTHQQAQRRRAGKHQDRHRLRAALTHSEGQSWTDPACGVAGVRPGHRLRPPSCSFLYRCYQKCWGGLHFFFPPPPPSHCPELCSSSTSGLSAQDGCPGVSTLFFFKCLSGLNSASSVVGASFWLLIATCLPLCKLSC